MHPDFWCEQSTKDGRSRAAPVTTPHAPTGTQAHACVHCPFVLARSNPSRSTCTHARALTRARAPLLAQLWLNVGGNGATAAKAGDKLGWFGYGWNFYGAASSTTSALGFTVPQSAVVTQLG